MNPGYGSRIDTPEELENVARAFQVSRLVLTALELDVFSVIAPEGSDVSSVCERMGTDRRATAMLLDALAAIGLLRKTGETFRCAPLAADALRRDSEHFMRPMLQHMAHLWESWSRLTEIVRSGRPSAPIQEPACQDNRVDSFIGAMHHFGLQQQAPFVQAIDWTGVRHVLDLGGGSGVYAISFCKAVPGLIATLFDRSPVMKLARGYIRDAGLTDRIRPLEGDMIQDDIGSGYDLVWLSNVIHSMSPEQVRTLFRKVFPAVNPGGRFVVRDFILEDTRIAPAFGAVFALNMLVNTPEGGCYTRGELIEWLDEVGFVNATLVSVEADTATRLMIAEKPRN